MTTQLQSGIPVKIVNESGEVVLDTVTAKLDANDMYDGGRFKIENLPAGTYIATIYPIEKWNPVERGEDKQYPLVPTFSTTFTLEDESATKNLYWLLTSRVHQVVSYSKVGRFKNGAYGDLFQNGSNVAFMFWYNGAKEGYEAKVIDNGQVMMYFQGTLYGDSVSQYPLVLTKPVLSEEEKAMGWTFKYWRLNVRKYSEEKQAYYREEAHLSDGELNNLVVNDYILMEAVYGLPKYTLRFATDTSKGTLPENAANVDYTKEGNVPKTIKEVIQSDQLPTITAKEGYKFLGLYPDLTTNTISNEDLLNKTINAADVTYYAKYERTVPMISISENNTWVIDGEDTEIPVTGPKGDKGDTVITFSDGSTITVKKGYKGETGATGEKGDKGDALTVTKSETNDDGDTVIYFSDGSNITVKKGD